jgi:hypothetical protein
MAYDVPTSVPTELTVGDTWTWTVPAGSFPAGEGWGRSFRFLGSGLAFEVPALAVGDGFQASYAMASTANVDPGTYQVVEIADNGTSRHTVARATVVVHPDPDVVDDGSHRAHDEKMLAAIEAVLEGRVTEDMESYSILGRSLQRIPFRELMQYRAIYAQKVRRARSGSGTYDRVSVQFGPVT